jgi:adenosylcobinamide-phosphate synthase
MIMFEPATFWMDAAAMGFAIVLDIALGEPPAIIHPVVYIGKAISWLERISPKKGRIAQLAYGIGSSLMVTAALAAAGYFIALAARQFNPILYIFVVGFLLKTCFAVRELGRSPLGVKRHLEAGNIAQARASLMGLVSRDTSNLTPELTSSAAVESVAENTTDSFVSPWLFFALFGLPGALAYRAVNTLDSMIGYRGQYEYLGKSAARIDDLLNLIPARLSAIAIAVAGILRRHSGRRALSVMSKEWHYVQSPNAGVSMAAMAGTLGIVLEKVGCYRLGAGFREAAASDIVESINIMRWVAALTFCLTFIILAGRHAIF